MKEWEFFNKFHFLEPVPTQDSLKLEEMFLKFSVSEFFLKVSSSSFDLLKKSSEEKALMIFKNAAVRIPAYKQFLKKYSIEPDKIKTVQDFVSVPTMDKENYLKGYSVEEMSWDGKPNGLTMISMSSGSTGQPYYWPRNNFLEYETALTHEIFSTIFKIKSKKTLVIDAYSMGAYVAGTFTLNSFRRISRKYGTLTVISPGLNIDEIIRIVQDLGSKHEQTIIAGYPPFVKDIIDAGILSGIKWGQLRLKLVLGAENFSEEWRQHIFEKCRLEGSDILNFSMNTFGSADCGVLGHETPLSINLRRVIHDRKLEKKIFNLDYLPTLVQYNPLWKFFENNNGRLIFTANGGIPLIKYDIGDEGKIFTAEEMCHNLKLNINEDDSKWLNFPIIALAGRRNNVVTLYGLNIYPEHIKRTLERSEFITFFSGKFKLKTKNSDDFNQYLEIIVELSTDVTIGEETKKNLLEKLVNDLQKQNFEYAKLYNKLGVRANPKILFVGKNNFKQVASKHRWAEH